MMAGFMIGQDFWLRHASPDRSWNAAWPGWFLARTSEPGGPSDGQPARRRAGLVRDFGSGDANPLRCEVVRDHERGAQADSRAVGSVPAV